MVVSNTDVAGLSVHCATQWGRGVKRKKKKRCRAIVHACRGIAATWGRWVCFNVTSLKNNEWFSLDLALPAVKSYSRCKRLQLKWKIFFSFPPCLLQVPTWIPVNVLIYFNCNYKSSDPPLLMIGKGRNKQPINYINIRCSDGNCWVDL